MLSSDLDDTRLPADPHEAGQPASVRSLFSGIDNEMELLLALGRHTVSELNLNKLLPMVAEMAMAVTHAETMAVPMINLDRGEYVYQASAGKNADLIRGQRFPLSVGMCGWVLSNEKPLLFGAGSDLPMGAHSRWESGMESALLVPLITEGRIIGGLSALGKKGGQSFNTLDLKLLTLFANQTSVAIENAQVVERLNAQQEELASLYQQARYEKQLSDVTLDAITDAVIVTDLAQLVVHCNRVAEVHTGLERDDMLGIPIRDVISLQDGQGEELEHPVTVALMDNRTVHGPDDARACVHGRRCFEAEYTAAVLRDERQRATGSVLTFRDVSRQRLLSSQIRHQATHDNLTGLINRHEFEQRLEHAIGGAANFDNTHVLCYLDLDRFKVVNDTCGHLAGDELLRQLSSLFQRHVRQRDTLARMGGDEFCILLENCPVNRAREITEAIRRDVEALRFSWEDQVFLVGVSVGLVGVDNSAGSLHHLLSTADQTCFLAKEQGRNRVRVYSPDDQEMALRSGQAHWVSRLNDALNRDRFILYAQEIQPVVMPAQRPPLHFEMLLRLINDEDENSPLPPGAFIPTAERYNLMPAIDRWVIRASLQHLVAGLDNMDTLGMCSINLSGQSLSDPEMVDFILEQLRESRIPASRICFEVTETAAIADLTNAQEFIKRLRRAGTLFSLDDFGSGMASYDYLKRLPVDFVKIDGSFVRDIESDPVDAHIVQSMSEVARLMDRRTVAEFVENDAIRRRLASMDIDFVQGFGVARPVPLQQFLSAS